jgi:hypothetical protein
MNGNYVIEWAPFRLKEGVEESALLAASEAMQHGFLSQQKGYVRRELVKTADGQWADVVYWDSPASIGQGMKAAMENPACLKYFELMAGVDHADPSMGVMHLSVMKSYS